MVEYFPGWFLHKMALVAIVIFILFGVDLLVFGARLMTVVSRFVNKSFHVDALLVRMLESLKNTSDHEFDVEHTILRGWHRFVAGAAMIGAAFLLFNLLPALK